MIYQPDPNEFSTGDAIEKLRLERDPEADPWTLDYQEGVDDNGEPCWVRDDGKIVHA